jgi:hypothetical protein
MRHDPQKTKNLVLNLIMLDCASNVPRSFPFLGIPRTQEQRDKLFCVRRRISKLARIRQKRGQTLADVEGSLFALSKMRKIGV